MQPHDWLGSSHRRLNPLTGDYVLVSPHRLDRPWLGERSETPARARPQYDPQCYLCPNNARAGGARNPNYTATFVFDNDFPALLPQGVPGSLNDRGLFVAHAETGRCRVLCFSPRHDLDIATLGAAEARAVVEAWAHEYQTLAREDRITAVTIFENRGEMMGASNPHPHGQIWANAAVPPELAKETASLERYARTTGSCLLCVYAEAELMTGERVVYSDERICVVVPFWAVWPFEALVLPRRHAGSIADLRSEERASLASAMQDLVSRYDRLFSAPFPYSMGFHQRPSDGAPHAEWHAHAHYYPPLLRSASIRKYLVGYEMLAQPQRDFTAETAAQRLRDA